MQRGGTPQPIDVPHHVGDLDPALRAQLLLDEPGREESGQVVGLQRLLRARMQVRRRRVREVRGDVVPVGGDLVLVEEDLRQFGHG
jgi:hypothetical protein